MGGRPTKGRLMVGEWMNASPRYPRGDKQDGWIDEWVKVIYE